MKRHTRTPGAVALVIAGSLLAPQAGALEMPEVWALVEGEIAWTRTDAAGVVDEDTSEAISTVELGAAWGFAPGWTAEIVLLAEDLGVTDGSEFHPTPGADDSRPDGLHVDSATLGWAGETASVTGGRMVVPFGSFETTVLSDPQTLELGETSNQVAMAGEFAVGPGTLTASMYHGATRTKAADRGGFTLGYGTELAPDWTLTGEIINAPGALRGTPTLVDLRLAHSRGPWTFGAELIQAVEDDAAGDEPRALAIDVGRDLGDGWSAGARVQHTSEFSVLGDNGNYREIAGAVHKRINKHVSVGVELLYGEEGNTDVTQATAQVAVEI